MEKRRELILKLVNRNLRGGYTSTEVLSKHLENLTFTSYIRRLLMGESPKDMYTSLEREGDKRSDIFCDLYEEVYSK